MTDLQKLIADVRQLQEDVNVLLALTEPGSESGIAHVPGLLPSLASPTTYLGSTSREHAKTAHLWQALTRGQAADAWGVLTTWVDWLVDRYQLQDTLPTCWYRHGAIVEELDALRAAWTSAYLNPDPTPNDAAIWHTLLAQALFRIHEWDRYGCTAGTHHDDVTTTRVDDLHVERAAYLEDDISARSRTHAGEIQATTPTLHDRTRTQ